MFRFCCMLTMVFAVTVIIQSCHTAKPVQQDDKIIDVSPPQQQGLELIGSNDCVTCHQLEEKGIGPSFKEIARRFKPTEKTIQRLVAKIISGGSGSFGVVPMTPHPDLSKQDATEMVKFILSNK